MAYTAFDRFVAWRRFRVALPHVRPLARVCDIRCGPDAPFPHHARMRISIGVGIDDQVAATASADRALIRGDITQGLPFRSGCFDHAIVLAVLEHLNQRQPLLDEIFRILTPGGSLIMTWPAAAVDPFIHILDRVGIVNNELGGREHQPRIPVTLLHSMLGEIGFMGSRHRTFEFGLNNLLVCYKPPGDRSASTMTEERVGARKLR